jgi:hypothetical protein
MTEAEWLACDDPIAMIEFARGSPKDEDAVTWGRNRWQLEDKVEGKDRKFRLLACAYCRRVWEQIPKKVNQDAVAAVEEFLEGRTSIAAVNDALQTSSSVEWLEDGSGRRPERGYWIVKTLGRGFYKMTAAASALLIAANVIFMADEAYGHLASFEFGCCYYQAGGVFLRPFQWPPPAPGSVMAERVCLAGLIRCVLGNPARAVPPLRYEPSQQAFVVSLAQVAYQDCDFSSLPIIADALEEAGCTDEALLSHLRLPGPHVRGCWAVDLVLGKG